MKFAPELPRRRQLAKDRKEFIAREGEAYGVVMGEYRQTLYLDEQIKPEQKRMERLYGIEHDLADQLIQYPGVLADRGIKRPAILLDFGGMVGLSAMRIAAQHNILSQIEQGKIAIVVTNLEYDLSADSVESVQAALPDVRTETALFIEIFRRAIHYLKGDAATLLRSSITLPDGQNVPLRGNVDVLHEQMALAHGFKNDLDIPRLGKLVSPVGQLWLGTKQTQMMQAADVKQQHDANILGARRLAHQQGMENLAELGLNLVPSTRPRSYQIFRHAQS